MNSIKETYNMMPTYLKEAVGFPDNFILLTNDQERFIMDLYSFSLQKVKAELKEILEVTTKEVEETLNDI